MRFTSYWLALGFALLEACGSSDDARAHTRDAGTHAAAGRKGVPGAGTEASDAGDHPVLTLCSGCASETRDTKDTVMRVHHVHLNVKSAREAIDFYAKFFGTKEVWLNETESAIWADPILFLLDEVTSDPPDTLQMGFEHVGMGVSDPTAWFEQAAQRGLSIDTRNGGPPAPVAMPAPAALKPFVDDGVDTFAYVYVRGPNRERVEVWSGLDTFRHVHFMTPDVDATVAWYDQLFVTRPIVPSAADALGFGNAIRLGNDVQLFFASLPAIAEFVPTDDRPLGHIAFSVTALDRQFARMEQLSVVIVSAPAQTKHGFRSFFVRGPQDVLIEFVEAGPVAAL